MDHSTGKYKESQAPSKDGANKSYPISMRQSVAIIASTLIGVSVLTLPREAAEVTGESAWIAVIGGAVLAMLAMAVIVKLSNRYLGLTICGVYGPYNRSDETSTCRAYARPSNLLDFFCLLGCLYCPCRAYIRRGRHYHRPAKNTT
ncbi:MAG: Spore germination protein [Paenibacillus sp.]|nr:Spore germination protein [Paenibacillus sp.]